MSESRDQPLHCHCSPGTLWRNVRAGTSPSPRPGENEQEVGPHTAQTKGSAEPSSFWRSGPSAERGAPSATPSDLLASEPPSRRAQVPGQGRSFNRCPRLSPSPTTRNAPPTPHHKHPRRLPPPPFYCLQRDKWLPPSTPKCTPSLPFSRSCVSEPQGPRSECRVERGEPGSNPRELGISDPPCPPRKDAGDL